jgi:hypothetical protein
MSAPAIDIDLRHAQAAHVPKVHRLAGVAGHCCVLSIYCAWVLAAWWDVVVPYMFIGQHIGPGAFRKIIKLLKELAQDIEECAALGVP